MELKIKIKVIKYKYNKILESKECTYLSKILLVLEIKNLLQSQEYTDKLSSSDVIELNNILEDMEYKLLNNIK